MVFTAYKDMAKQSISYVHKFNFPSKYAEDILRDIVVAITSLYPEFESEGGNSYC
tara:strand:+ start:300 stop:464 length:165 start_codon:yes stop_codon:yes gene_type:complete